MCVGMFRGQDMHNDARCLLPHMRGDTPVLYETGLAHAPLAPDICVGIYRSWLFSASTTRRLPHMRGDLPAPEVASSSGRLFKVAPNSLPKRLTAHNTIAYHSVIKPALEQRRTAMTTTTAPDRIPCPGDGPGRIPCPGEAGRCEWHDLGRPVRGCRSGRPLRCPVLGLWFAEPGRRNGWRHQPVPCLSDQQRGLSRGRRAACGGDAAGCCCPCRCRRRARCFRLLPALCADADKAADTASDAAAGR